MRRARAALSGRRRNFATTVTAVSFFAILDTTIVNMAGRRLPSDPEYLLTVMAQLGEESGSEDEFDGWLGDDDDRTAITAHDEQLQLTSLGTSRGRSRSLAGVSRRRS